MNAVHLNDQISFNINVKVAIHVDPMIRAEALVYTYVYKDKNDVYQVDTMDCEVNWFLKNLINSIGSLNAKEFLSYFFRRS